MNWLGLSLRSLFGIVVGVAVGLALFLRVYPSVVLVGACAGAGCALFAGERSGLRGISVATAATWAAAAIDAHRLGVPTLAISTTLDGPRWVAYLGCVVLSAVLGALSVRREAKTRLAGT